MAGAPYPMAGKSSVDVVRAEHNSMMHALSEKNKELSKRYFALHLNTVKPFLEESVATHLGQVEGVVPVQDLASIVAVDAAPVEGVDRPSTNICEDSVMSLPSPVWPQPEAIVGTMRSYQLQGYSWMYHMFRHGMNSILADEMGLGKVCLTDGFLVQAPHSSLCRHFKQSHFCIP